MQRCNKVLKSIPVLLMISCACASGNVSAGNGTVQFTANINTIEYLNPSSTACAVTGRLGAGGGGKGKSDLFVKENNKNKNDNTITLAMSDCVAISGDAMSFTNGEFTMTGANGDKITAVYSGQLKYVKGDPVTAAEFEFTPGLTTFQITGGTGRYKHATGGGTITGTETVNSYEGTAKGVLSANGSIVY